MYFWLTFLTLRQFPVRATCGFAALVLAFTSFFFFRVVERLYEGMIEEHPTLVIGSATQGLLPLSITAEIESLEPIARVSPVTAIGQTYFQSPRNEVQAIGVDTRSYMDIFDLEMSASVRECFQTQRVGAIATPPTATRNGWIAGNTVPLISTFRRTKDGTRTWPFLFCGVFQWPKIDRQPSHMLFDYNYVVEFAYPDFPVELTSVVVSLEEGYEVDVVSEEIDGRFRNHHVPTTTMAPSQVQRNMVRRVGNVGFLASLFGLSLLGTLLSVNHALLVQALRERTPEFRTLYAIGFGRGELALRAAIEYFAFLTVGAMSSVVFAAALHPFFAELVEHSFGPVGFTWWTGVETIVLGMILGVGLGGLAWTNVVRRVGLQGR